MGMKKTLLFKLLLHDGNKKIIRIRGNITDIIL
jgi:hypothetical protein